MSPGLAFRGSVAHPAVRCAGGLRRASGLSRRAMRRKGVAMNNRVKALRPAPGENRVSRDFSSGAQDLPRNGISTGGGVARHRPLPCSHLRRAWGSSMRKQCVCILVGAVACLLFPARAAGEITGIEVVETTYPGMPGFLMALNLYVTFDGRRVPRRRSMMNISPQVSQARSIVSASSVYANSSHKNPSRLIA